jgi:hypothetical protein
MGRVHMVIGDRTCIALAGPRCANTGPANLPLRGAAASPCVHGNLLSYSGAGDA